MDKSKGKKHSAPTDLIALGTKSASSSGGGGASKQSTSTASSGKTGGGSGSTSSGTKREGGSSSTAPPSKKLRISPTRVAGSISTSTSSSKGSSSSSSKGTSSSSSLPKVKKESSSTWFSEGVIGVQELTTDKFFKVIEKANKAFPKDCELAQGALLPALRRLKSTTAKDKELLQIAQNVILVVKSYPHLFRTTYVLDALMSLMEGKKQDVTGLLKAKLMPAQAPPFMSFVLFVIYILYCDETHWPIHLVQLWFEDASGDRLWVDKPILKPLVDNIWKSCGTVAPSAALMPTAEPGGPGSSSPNPLASDDPASSLAAGIDQLLQDNKEAVIDSRDPEDAIRPRYSNLETNLESIVLEYAQDVVTKRSPDIPRNMLKALSEACGLSEIRSWVVTKLEQWLHNGKLGRWAQELLLHLAVNANSTLPSDFEVINKVCMLRMKTKPLTNFVCIAVREMVRDNDANLRQVIESTIYNELSPQRNPNNLPILGAVVAGVPESRAVLADVFLELLYQKREDFHPALRLLLREIVRAARYEGDLSTFCEGLMRQRDINFHADSRERTFLAIADLILLSMFLSVSPQVREASAVAAVRGEPKDITTLQNFRILVKEIQASSIMWMYSVVPKMFKPAKANYYLALNKLFFKDPVNDLMTKDGWPPESEKNMFSRLIMEVGLQESSLVFVLMMGVSKDHPLSAGEALDLVDQMIVRSAVCKTGLTLQKLEIMDLLFRLSEYRHPDNIVLPLGYEPPKMAVSNFYWRSWALMCVLTAYNPLIYGEKAWSDFPMLKVFMEMCMTNSFVFPTSSCLESETNDEIISREVQTAALEKEEILEFETHLAAASSKATITEQTSLLLKQLMRLDPLGPPRTPPAWILSQLQSWNDQMGLGHLLCGSRNPDFLLDLIHRNSEPMPWLARLVSEGSFEILPDQCLCEFMMGHMEALERALVLSRTEEVGVPGKSPRKGHKGQLDVTGGLSKEDTKLLQLVQYLQEKVHSSSDEGEGRKVLEYFLRRLSAPKMQQRKQALNALRLLLVKDDEASSSSTSEDWLLDCLPALPVFSEIQETVLVLLRQAILVENDPATLCRFLEFLSTWASVCEDLEGLALDVANLVVERNGMMCLMMSKYPSCFAHLFDIFFIFIKKVRGPHKETYKWCDSADQVLVTWKTDRQEGIMNILVIHAIVMLLSSYSAHMQEDQPQKGTKGKKPNSRFTDLMDIWFPSSKSNTPKGYLLNTSEEAVLFPDWIRLKMIRANNPRLLEAATQGLDVEHLILFVQHFGVPVQSMTALLYIMDTVSQTESEKVVRAASQANPQFLYNLIQAQWKRGADGGKKFVHLLLARCGVGESMDVDKHKEPKPAPVRTALQLGTVKEKEIKKPPLPSTRQSVGAANTSTSSESSFIPTPFNKRKNIENLSKELLQLASPPSGRRRSSVPASKHDDSLNQTPRRHSAHVEDKSDMDVSEESQSPSKYLGQLVDQITQVEPCIVRNALEYQLPLLFGKSESVSGCRSVLMTALAHQAGWETIHRCLSLFMREFDPSNDPSSILDLIQATHSNPKLFQGVDKHVPKHQLNLSVMKLSPQQLVVMAEYIIEEVSQLEMKNTKFSITNLLGPVQSTSNNSKKSKQGLPSRVKLWLQCAQQDTPTVNSVIHSLLEKKWRNPCVKRFVLQVYVEFPQVILLDNWRWRAGGMPNMSEDEMASYLDGISHALITALANTQPGKDWGKKQARDYEICLRKLASLHPTLMLRQLSLMGSLLEGRVHLESGAFHLQNHNLPFIIFLALFEMMQPHILKHFKTLKPTFALYIKMFQNYGSSKDYGSSLSRFSILLHNFLSVNCQEVKEFLGPHYTTLRELSTLKYYSEVVPLHNLLSCLDPIAVASSSSGSAPSSSIPQPITTSSGSGADYLSSITTSLHDRLLNASNDEETVPILQELDAISNRSPIVLNKFSENLNSLIKSESEACRSLAFSLVLKHCTYYPSKSVTYLDTILQLLEDDSAHLRDTMIDRVHEFVILAQERGHDILTRMFQLGISSNANFLTSIQKALALLRNYSSLACS